MHCTTRPASTSKKRCTLLAADWAQSTTVPLPRWTVATVPSWFESKRGRADCEQSRSPRSCKGKVDHDGRPIRNFSAATRVRGNEHCAERVERLQSQQITSRLNVGWSPSTTKAPEGRKIDDLFRVPNLMIHAKRANCYGKLLPAHHSKKRWRKQLFD